MFGRTMHHTSGGSVSQNDFPCAITSAPFLSFLILLTLTNFMDSRADSLTCTFVDQRGQKVGGVKVTLTHLPSESQWKQESNNEGQVQFMDLGTGSLHISGRARGLSLPHGPRIRINGGPKDRIAHSFGQRFGIH